MSADIARMAACIDVLRPAPPKLRLLADWFDVQDAHITPPPGDEAQRALREWADALDGLIALEDARLLRLRGTN